MEALEKTILFTSDRFDFLSELPEEYNAGNRFYGRDVAAWLCARLQASGFEADFLDEDWGWLILGRAAPATSFEIGIYNLNGHGEGSRPGAPEWGLRLTAFERRKWFWRFHRNIRIPLPSAIDNAIAMAIAEAGATARPWDDDSRA